MFTTATTMSNRAAFITGLKEHPLKVADAPMPQVEAHQMIVRVHSVAINPCDSAIQNAGVLLTDFPAVMGEDLAGEVISIGNSVTRFRPGDRVVALAADIKLDKPFCGSFQQYCRVDETSAALIPDNIAYSQAAVLPVCLCTAATSINLQHNLALPHPSLDPEPTGKVLVVWGAASSVGSCAVQLALAAGYEVATTSSPHNFQYCRDLGAKWVFDYKSETVVQEIVEALKGKDSAGVMCSVLDDPSELKCAQIAHGLGGNKFIGTVKPEMPPFSKLEGAPEGVEIGWCDQSEIQGDRCEKAIWADWLTKALETGQMKCKPDPEIVGKGLEKIQDAIDIMSKGVSAKKLVVEL